MALSVIGMARLLMLYKHGVLYTAPGHHPAICPTVCCQPPQRANVVPLHLIDAAECRGDLTTTRGWVVTVCCALGTGVKGGHLLPQSSAVAQSSATAYEKVYMVSGIVYKNCRSLSLCYV